MEEASTSNAPILDATSTLAGRQSKKAQLIPKTTEPLTFDLGLLAAFDPSPLDVQAYNSDRESFLISNAREGLQGLINALWDRPTTVSDEGVMASLPDIQTVLPREKPLPKPKELSKWDRFAKSKGIEKRPKKERMVWDEEKQDYVARWGYKGKNKDPEDQWLVEVPANADNDFNPRTAAKEERKARVAKNESQRMANITRNQAASSKKQRSRRK